MKKQDALFQLIKSLTRGEKRNFRMLAQLTSGDKKYVQLFDVMDHLEEYDEAKILKKFKRDDKFEKQFAYNKNYLYNTILNSLVYFHKGIDAELSSLTMQVRILMEKSLFFQAKKLLNKAKESVAIQEKFEELLKLLRIENEILKRTENMKVLPGSLRQIEFEEKVTMDKIINLMGFRRLETQTYLLLQTRHVARKEGEEDEVAKLLANTMLQEESAAMSNRARILFNEIRRRIAYYKGDHETALVFAERSVKIYDAAKAIKEDEKLDYINRLALYAHHKLWVYGAAAARPLIERIKGVVVNTQRERNEKFERYYLYSLTLFVSIGETAPEGFFEEFAEELGALENDMAVSTRLLSNYFCADYYVIQEDFSKALFWINRFLNHPRTNIRTDLQAGARLVNLIIHYELGNFDLIEYNLKSTYRYIYKQERMHNYERRVLRFFKDAISETEAGRIECMRVFRDDIIKIMEDPFEERASQIFNILVWLNSRLDGIPIRDAKANEANKLIGIKNKKAESENAKVESK